MSMINKPNFFIVGAPKCGTTAMAEYLKMHPDIYVCEPKEPHYFADDFPRYQYVKREEDYLRYFINAASSEAIGEASVWYLYSKNAIQNIRTFNKKAKLILMFRNPIEYLKSLHWQLLYSMDEEEKDFEKAWMLQKWRAGGRFIPRTCRERDMLQYREVALFGRQLERALEVFPPDQLKIIFFEDFAQDPSRAYKEVIEYLGVREYAPKVFKRVNVAKQHRARWIGRITERPPVAFRNAVKIAKRAFGISGNIGVTEQLRNWNRVKGGKREISKEFKEKLIYELTDDVEKLGVLTQRNLKQWLS